MIYQLKVHTALLVSSVPDTRSRQLTYNPPVTPALENLNPSSELCRAPALDAHTPCAHIYTFLKYASKHLDIEDSSEPRPCQSLNGCSQHG